MSFITYPLKNTIAIPLDVIFEQYITQSYGGEPVWNQVKNVFVKVSQLRGEFLFDQYNLTIANDPISCAKFIEKLLTYYRYLIFLQSKFRFEYFQQGSVKIPFQWSNSFDPKKIIAVPSLIVEKASVLYNLAVLYNTDGSGRMISQSVDERKIASQKFRFGLWCIAQIKQLTINIAPEVKAVHADLSDDNLDTMYHTMLGNCYAILYLNLLDQENKIKVNNIASLASEASQNYTIALSKVNAMIQSGGNLIPLDHLQRVKAYLFFNIVSYVVIAGIKMAKWHADQQEDDIKGGHIGWALGYIQNSLNSIKKAQSNEGVMKILESAQKEQLNRLKNECDTQFAILNQRNTQIYNHPVPDEKKLPRTRLPDQLIVQPAEPKEMQIALGIDESVFFNFLNEDQIQLIQEIKTFAQSRGAEVEGVQKQIFEMKTNAYLEHYVNFFIELMSDKQQPNQQLPQKIAEKIAKFKQLGGSQKITGFVQAIKDNNIQCGMLLNEIKSQIEKEQTEDDSLLKEYAKKWTRSPSTTVNKDYLAELKNLEENFKIACSIEMENQQRWQNSQETLKLIEQPIQEQLKVFASGSTDQNFCLMNIQELSNLNTTNTEITKIMTSIKDSVKDINNSIRNINYQSEVGKAMQARVSQDKILETVLTPISNQITCLNDMVRILNSNFVRLNFSLLIKVSLFSTKVSEICAIALSLQQKRNAKGNQGNQMQIMDSHLSSLNVLVELFDDCEQGMQFYQDLTTLVLDLDKKVSDFLKAREIEKNNLIQMIINSDQSKNALQNCGFNAPILQTNYPNPNQYPQQSNIFAQPQMPYGGQQMPYGGQQMPYGGQQMPYGGQQMPYGGQQMPFGGQQMPYGGQQMPYGGQQMPYGGMTQGQQGGQLPQQQQQMPSQYQHQQPFYQGGQFDQGKSVFIPKK